MLNLMMYLVMKTILLNAVSLEEFKSILREIVDEELVKYLSTQSDPEEYLTRKETASLLKISLPTLHNYSKQGLIKSHRVLNQIRYKKSEIESSMNEIRDKRYSKFN